MATKTLLIIALGMAFGCARAQTSSQPPTELQPGYPGYPASVTPGMSASESPAAEVSPVPEPPPVTTSSGTSSVSQSNGSAVSTPPPDMHAPPGMAVKPLSPPAPMTRVEPITEGGITYLCGGVGLDEADQMKQEARNYDLLLTFAAHGGSYLADVNVDIADARGQSLLKASCGAPMMLVDLPKSGNYRIHAETGGRTLTRTVQVRDMQRGKAVTMVWPDAAIESAKPAN